jgi:hypothetical protein
MMKRLLPILIVALSWLGAEGLVWHKAVKKIKPLTTNAHHGGHGGMSHYELKGFKDGSKVSVDYYLANLEKKSMEYPKGGMCLPKSPFGNYHALVATGEIDGKVYSATTYIYKHGRPAKVSPTKLTSIDKVKFEIRPIHLPREHDRYTADKKYGFMLNFEGKPLANQSIKLSTSNGSKLSFTSDSNGELKVTLPSDFKEVKKTRRGNRPANFILSATYQNYHTTLTMPYHINPNNHWQSIPYGILVMLLGMLAGFFIYRRVNNG